MLRILLLAAAGITLLSTIYGYRLIATPVTVSDGIVNSLADIPGWGALLNDFCPAQEEIIYSLHVAKTRKNTATRLYFIVRPQKIKQEEKSYVIASTDNDLKLIKMSSSRQDKWQIGHSKFSRLFNDVQENITASCYGKWKGRSFYAGYNTEKKRLLCVFFSSAPK